MSDLKFSCPSCGQHIQCDESHSGENIPCPDCAHLIRVPPTAKVVLEPKVPIAETAPPATDESKVSYTPAEPEKKTSDETIPTLEENFLAPPGTQPPSARPPVTEREQEIAAARAS